MLDIIKAFAIFLVLWGHSLQHFTNIDYSTITYRIIYSFHMPLFMAIVGYFALPLLRESFISVFLKKFRQLILPAISFTLIFFLLGCYEYNGFIPFIKKLINNFWFLRCAFVCFIYFYIFAFNQKFRNVGILVSLLLSPFITYQHFEIMYPSFVLGYFLRNYRCKIESSKKSICLISGVIFITLLIFFDEKFWRIPSFTLNLNSPDFIQYWYLKGYLLIIGILGVIFFLSLFLNIAPLFKSFYNSKYVNKVGQYTLGIYLLQALLIEIILRKYINIGNSDTFLYNFVICPAISLIVLIICVSIIDMINRFKVLSFVLLGKKLA